MRMLAALWSIKGHEYTDGAGSRLQLRRLMIKGHENTDGAGSTTSSVYCGV